jgi:alpha-L-fucosidase 2
MRYTNRFLLSLLFVLGITLHLAGQSSETDLKLWYNTPAKDWNEALPVGNGSLGGMIFGRVDKERIQLNEKTVWAGVHEEFSNPAARESLPKIRQLLFQSKYTEAQSLAQNNLMGNKKNMSAYQTLGDLFLDFGHQWPSITNYKRDLDLDRAVASVSYSFQDVTFRREIFSSHPDQAMVIRLSASKPGSLAFVASMVRPGDKADIQYSSNAITLTEHVNGGRGVKAAAVIRLITNGGTVVNSDKGIEVRGANESIIIISASTDYFGENPLKVANSRADAASAKNFERLLSDHIKDYKDFFGRVALDLGTTDAVFFPTDQRLIALKSGSNDPHLIALYYQFGRYLLISSSRAGTLPANLQGLWADGLNPPWDADYHININIQMNYWPAETTNLSELHAPLFNFLDSLRSDGRKTAKNMYGARGVVAHFTTDAFFFTEPYGQTQWAMWPMGYAWTVQHAWEHFLFTQDKIFLKSKAYPMMKDAAIFCLDWLVEHPGTKKLVSGPSISPENRFKTRDGEIATMVMGPTMDHMIIRGLFESVVEASTVLNVDEKLRTQLHRAISKLAPTQLTSDGRIMEWTEEFEEPEPGHRHISHLYGLYPGNEINRQSNPALLEGARKTIEHRLAHGGGHTGWSRAWIINFFARLHDSNKAYLNLTELLKKSTLPNLFDNHPPFQIDGNFGAVAGVTEMLLQSHAGEIEILPALPEQWNEGSVSGLCARGGYEVDIRWKNGELENCKIVSKNGGTCQVRYRDLVIQLQTSPNSMYVLNSSLQIISQ